MSDLTVPEGWSHFAYTIMKQKYAHEGEEWGDVAARVAGTVLGALGIEKRSRLTREVTQLIAERKFIPGGRYLYATGRPFHQVNNCFLFRAEDTREGWSDLLHKATMSLMTGGGIGADYTNVRPRGAAIGRTGGSATGPIALMNMVNEAGRYVMQGGSRRSAIWAGLSWRHPDIHEFITLKNWAPEVRQMKEQNFSFPATMDGTNISVLLDDDFFHAIEDKDDPLHSLAHGVYWATVRQMLKTAEPGFSIDCGKNSRETLRNACTEITSRDDSDVCNLGSVNLARITSPDEMARVVNLGVLFLLAGTVYSDVPFDKVREVRERNRRLGLGLMGVHEWLLMHGEKYAPSQQLGEYLDIYKQSGLFAQNWCNKYGLSVPIATRAIAPNGTIGIVGETTTSAEPILCVAYKRRYLKGSVWNYQYVVDPTAKRLMELTIPEYAIEDAYSLAENVERRVAFQAWLQQYVDHGISSTINLPSWGSELNNDDTVQAFGKMLLRYLPKLRGLTCYPDGARGGQPLVPVKLKTALSHVGEVFVEGTDICDLTKAGSCG